MRIDGQILHGIFFSSEAVAGWNLCVKLVGAFLCVVSPRWPLDRQLEEGTPLSVRQLSIRLAEHVTLVLQSSTMIAWRATDIGGKIA